MSNIRHITLPAGFVSAGVKAGIKVSGKEDVAIIAGLRDCSAALLTTRNQVFGEPVRYCRQVLPKGYGVIRAMVINSGCSNVCTGQAGFRDVKEMAALTAKKLATQPGKVLVASTGIIGHRLPMQKVRAGIAAAAANLGTNNDQDTLRAIMTTDTREKSAVVTMTLGGKQVTLASAAAADVTNQKFVVHKPLERVQTLQEVVAIVEAAGVLQGQHITYDPVTEQLSLPIRFQTPGATSTTSTASKA